jgi:hypothetical protein
MKRIIIALCLVATVARADYTATFGSVAVTNNLRVTNNITAGGEITAGGNITGRDLRATNNLYSEGYSWFYGPARFDEETYFTGLMSGETLNLTNTLTVDKKATFFGGYDVYKNATTFGTNIIMFWDRLQLDGGETLPVYMSNVVAIATQAITAAFLGALTNVPSLSAVLSNGNDAAGQSVLNLASISGSGRMALGENMSLDNIDSTATGAHQSGSKLSGDVMTIGISAVGAEQRILMANARAVIGPGCYGASQHGLLTTGGDMEIDNPGYGVAQRGILGGSRMYANAVGAQQYGYLFLSSATNLGNGALQLFDLNTKHALTTADGDGSILLGAGTASNRYAIVAGDGQVSHGDGSITAGGGFYGSGSNLIGITAAQVGAVSTNGGRLSAGLFSDVDYVTTSPQGDEIPTAEWVRSLAIQGAEWYFTPDITNGFGEKTTNFVALSTSTDGAFTNSIAAPESDSYFVGGITTQLYGEVRSPITFEVWAFRSGPALSLPCHPEIYYVYNGTTNNFGDWEAGSRLDGRTVRRWKCSLMT